MARVYKRPESKTLWWMDIRHRRDPVTKKWRRIREPAGQTKAEAQAYLDRRLKELELGQALPSRRREAFDLEALQKLWLESSTVTRKKSLSDDRSRFASILTVLGAGMMVDQLTTEHIEDLIKDLRRGKHNGGRKISEATVNRHLSLLRSALKEASRRGHQHRDPMRDHKMAKEHSRKRAPSQAEMRSLLAAADSELRAILTLAIETGARLGEICAFEWRWIDSARRTLRIPGAMTKTGEDRIVPLSATASKTIKELPERKDDPKIFTLSRDRASNRFHHLAKRLKISDLRLHDLRRGAASNMRRSGADIATISEILGHQSLAMVRKYQLISDADKVKAVDRASALRKRSKK